MTALKFPALVAALLIALSAQAEQVVNVSANGQASDLQCPKNPARAAVKTIRPAAAEDEVLEAPAPDELEGLPAGQKAAPRLSGFEHLSAPGDRPLSIAFWGDSHFAAAFFSEELGRISGFAKQEIQPTFIPAGIGRGGVRLPVRKHCIGGGWSYKFAYVRQTGAANFAPGLSQLKAPGADAYLWVDFRQQPDTPALRSLDILFAAPAGDAPPATIAVAVDDGEEKLITLDQPDGILRIAPDNALSVVRLRVVDGNPTFEGFRPQYLTNAKLRMDTLAIPGSTVRGWANADTEYLRSRLGSINYDVVMLEYGTNEGNQRPFDPQAYTADLRTALGNLRRVFPSAQCLLVGPTDRGVMVRHVKAKKKGRKKVTRAVPKPDLLHFARIHQQISEIQRSVGRDYGCGFWNWQDAMGGPGGAYRWLYATPRLMAKDLIHLSVPGYQQSARAFATDVHFEEWFGPSSR
jgi:lysophospholipase L1-like esterase